MENFEISADNIIRATLSTAAPCVFDGDSCKNNQKHKIGELILNYQVLLVNLLLVIKTYFE